MWRGYLTRRTELIWEWCIARATELKLVLRNTIRLTDCLRQTTSYSVKRVVVTSLFTPEQRRDNTSTAFVTFPKTYF